jgi:hypothetical protein
VEQGYDWVGIRKWWLPRISDSIKPTKKDCTSVEEEVTKRVGQH